MAIGPKELLIILLIGLLVFGAKMLRTMGSDLGAAVGEFKKGLAWPNPDSQVDPKTGAAKEVRES